MKCNKCDVDVPSSFEFAIAQNMCPKCGNKLLRDEIMSIYLDIKNKLAEVELVMDPTATRERIAMFLVNNYEISPLNNESITRTLPAKASAPLTAVTPALPNKEAFLRQIASLDSAPDLSMEDIRAQEASRAQELADAREMGVDLDEDEELVGTGGARDIQRVQRLKEAALAGRSIIKRANQ